MKPARPMCHWSMSARASRFGLGRVDVVVAGELRVDDDLGAGPRLDAVDDRLGPDDRIGRQDAGEVVDRAVVLRVREGRPRRRFDRRRAWTAGPLERRLDDLPERDQDGVVQVAGSEQRQHVVLVDRLALVVGEVGRREPGTGVELDLAVRQARVELEQDHEPVVDAGATDAPLVHQRGRVRFGLLGSEIVAAHRLGVDDDLDAGLRLDRVDDLLRLRDGLRPEDPREVVDGLALDRLRVRRPGRRRRRRRARPEDAPHREHRPGERGHDPESGAHPLAAAGSSRHAGTPTPACRSRRRRTSSAACS